MVKASDSKSDSLWERRFESYQLRSDLYRINFFNFSISSVGNVGVVPIIVCDQVRSVESERDSSVDETVV